MKYYLYIITIIFFSLGNANAGKYNKFTDRKGNENQYFWAAIKIVSTSDKTFHHGHELSFKTKEACNSYLLKTMDEDNIGLNYVYSKSRIYTVAIDVGGRIKAMDPPRGMGISIICMAIPLPLYN